MTRKLPWHLGFSPYPHRMWISLCIAVAFGRKCTGKQHRSATWSKKCQTALFHWNQALARETMCPWSGGFQAVQLCDDAMAAEVGRGTCRERGCQYVSIQVVGGSIKKKKKKKNI